MDAGAENRYMAPVVGPDEGRRITDSRIDTERVYDPDDVVVGVNEYVTDSVDDVDILTVDPEAEKRQVKRLAEFKSSRDQDKLDERLACLRDIARSEGNMLPPVKAALREGASIGEVCGALREGFGGYQGGAFL